MAESDDYTRDAANLIIGPWAHGGEFHSAYGAYNFGMENDGAGQDINGKMLSWFDYHIKGKQNNVSSWSKVRYFMLGSNTWRHANAWPPEEAILTPFYLRSEGRLDTETPADDEEPDCYTYDPMDPPPGYAPGKEDQFDPLPD